MAVIVISALCSLANDTDAIDARLEALVSLLLAVVAIQFVFSDELPHVDAATLADKYILTTFMIVGATLVFSSVMYRMQASYDWDRPDMERMNVIYGFATFIAWVVLHVAWYFQLRDHFYWRNKWKAESLNRAMGNHLSQHSHSTSFRRKGRKNQSTSGGTYTNKVLKRVNSLQVVKEERVGSKGSHTVKRRMSLVDRRGRAVGEYAHGQN